jgi:hypothetical protein
MKVEIIPAIPGKASATSDCGDFRDWLKFAA